MKPPVPPHVVPTRRDGPGPRSWAWRLLSRLAVALACGAGILGHEVAWAGPTVYVYLPTSLKARALQTDLAAAMPGCTVTVFGKIGDLETAMTTARPDAVVSLRPVLETRGLPVHLQGTRAGVASETYVAVSTKPLTADQLAAKVVGSVDLLGRTHMDKFVTVLVGTSPSLKRVQEIPDLLPLLQFEIAEAVLLPESAVQQLATGSQLDLKVIKLANGKVGLAAVSFLDDADRSTVESSLSALSPDVRKKIGIDAWGK